MPDAFPQPPDPALLRRVADGDRVAFSELYDASSGLLFSVAVAIVRDERAAEDILQDVYLQAWERAASYDPALGAPLGWLVTMARNRAIDWVRTSRRRLRIIEEAPESALPLPSPVDSAHEVASQNERSAVIRRVLNELPPDQRSAIELAFLRGLTQTEIAEVLGEPLGTIKARIRRGMLRLRGALADCVYS